MITKPILAVNADLNKINFPCIGLPKLDGIRCLIINGHAVSRNFKPIRNKHIREKLSSLPNGLDGELICGDFNKTSSSVMSEDGKPDFNYFVFDYVKDDLNKGFLGRYEDYVNADLPDFCIKVEGVILHDIEELRDYESKMVDMGYEGIMIRSLDGRYKCGRSTLKEGFLLKIKRFQDSEAEIIGFQELMHNNNTLEKDELGHAKRSTKKEGMIGSNTLGAFLVKDYKGIEFSIASGLNDELRKTIWFNNNKYLGKIIKFKYQEITKDGMYRFPVFLGFRDKNDL